jgi:uncharacterized protein YggE
MVDESMGGEQRCVAVEGVGSVDAAPDVATVELGISVVRARVSEAMSVASQAANAVMDAMDGHEVSVATSHLSVHPEHDHSGGRQRLIGYRVTNVVAVRTFDLDAVGSIVDSAAGAGGDALVVHGLVFGLRDPGRHRVEARRIAWDDAFDRATQLARMAEASLGAVLSIEEGDGAGSAELGPTVRLAMAEMATPIEAGTRNLTVRLRVRFALKT